jgi:hypothetical protein
MNKPSILCYYYTRNNVNNGLDVILYMSLHFTVTCTYFRYFNIFCY